MKLLLRFSTRPFLPPVSGARASSEKITPPSMLMMSWICGIGERSDFVAKSFSGNILTYRLIKGLQMDCASIRPNSYLATLSLSGVKYLGGSASVEMSPPLVCRDTLSPRCTVDTRTSLGNANPMLALAERYIIYRVFSLDPHRFREMRGSQLLLSAAAPPRCKNSTYKLAEVPGLT